ncbi:MAG: hypothetical protein AAF502_25645 [Bacteroidota bacterium]
MSDPGMKLNIEVTNPEVFEAIVRRVFNEIKEEQKIQLDPWITQNEAMHLLRIKSKSTFLKYRDLKKFKYSKPMESAKYILYERQSILDFIKQGIVEDEG